MNLWVVICFVLIFDASSSAALHSGGQKLEIAADEGMTMLQGGGGDADDFFRTASASISHDKNVLKRLEKHPLAHASGWNIQQNQSPGGKGWTESSHAAGPRLGGKAWEKKNDQLERELEKMSSSVNVMFKDQSDKRAYRRDEDKLFNQAVHALKTADQLYPDTPGDSTGSLSGLGLHTDSSFASDDARRRRRSSSSSFTAPLPPQSGPGMVRASRRQQQRIHAWYFGPSLTEVGLILIGCTLLAAAAWIGFMFFRRKTYYDLRVDRDRPEGIEVP
mmetsp:Transcript_55698/g.113864  ORF Transcript_55698/g.113864 Transcript_55698/m.113864 type:complete len:276 (+) Transcript_55698:390-1217(+)|eukprot:CAMPEP_0181313676 /NCGR_PEP_ID=MMETSP1101-20121128/14379_1 /TAXON_ID=46948 /ORGANISM="Rhodomonas abbreviata, Strain Caron Lab Isolate" /LENGTH=275 /DNA_ID=CAMNT_0023420653 /DNA_START=389 /DNA_END=1216 /DNA_ORIENTATION=-